MLSRSLPLTIVRISEMLRVGSCIMCWQFSGMSVIVPMPRSIARSYSSVASSGSTLSVYCPAAKTRRSFAHSPWSVSGSSSCRL